ncbi:MAG: hypothetical protein ACI8QY_000488, partial [bacterium]
MYKKNVLKKHVNVTSFNLMMVFCLLSSIANAQPGAPVPGYVPPLTVTQAPNYADDTRGVFVPSHTQHRMKTDAEIQSFQKAGGDSYSNGLPTGSMLLAQAYSSEDSFERELNRISNGHVGSESNLNRVKGQGSAQGAYADQDQGYNIISSDASPAPQVVRTGEGIEIAQGAVQQRTLDMTNSLVRLREDQVSIRRALQRMMDQIGGGEWTIVWDMAEQNAALPEMEISIYTEEPFMNVLNALVARIQTRSGQPLRVIRYDNTQRLVITDRTGGHRLAGMTSSVGVGDLDEVAVTENVLKETMVSLHYDEVPLVDALENIVNQAGKGEWRLRVYAGLDQVLKPAHIEEPFAIALERLLRLFNLKYEVFPGGKLIVITH